MAKNNLHVTNYEELIDDLDDQRWRKNSFGVPETGQNGVLVVDEAAQAVAEGYHGYLPSGVALVRKGDAGTRSTVHVAAIDPETDAVDGEVVGFLQSVARLKDANGEWFSELAVGIQTGGEIYPQWLPIQIADEDIPDRFGKSPL